MHFILFDDTDYHSEDKTLIFQISNLICRSEISQNWQIYIKHGAIRKKYFFKFRELVLD